MSAPNKVEPSVIKLVRHGLSESNTGKVIPAEIGDFRVKLERKGIYQAKAVGKLIGPEFIKDALLYRSPYRRTRQTMDHLIKGAGLELDDVRIFEDPRLREIDTGYEDYEAQQKRREQQGWFYYRYSGGESPADVFDRIATFLDTFYRQIERKGASTGLIVTHGLTIRAIVMRFLHLSVEDFERLKNPDNCDVITIAHLDKLTNPQFVSGNWGVEGLKLRDKPRKPGVSDNAVTKDGRGER